MRPLLSVVVILSSCMSDGKDAEKAADATDSASYMDEDEDWDDDGDGGEDWSDGDTADWGDSGEDWSDGEDETEDEADTGDSGALTCADAPTEAVTLYLSADDSNSQAAPVIARAFLDEGSAPRSAERPWEFLNYYTFDYTPADAGSTRVVAGMRASATPDTWELLVAVVAPEADPDDRRPLNLTFSVDTSGSMAGDPLDLAKETMLAVASELQEGDIVSLVSWSSSAAVTLDSEEVDGPDDPELLDAIDALASEGSTNLENGLRSAYELARNNFSADRTNRVILISDGGANTGETDEDLIAQESDDGESEGIYLIGVGASEPDSYDDALMDTITDIGKGAYIFVDSPSEAVRQFTGARFLSNLEVAAKDVQLAMTLPAGWLVERFDGEQMSTDPDRVREQHLAPNDAMIYHMVLEDCGADATAPLAFEVTWEEPRSGVLHADTASATPEEMQGLTATQIDKAVAILAYADALDQVPSLPSSQRRDALDAAYEVARSAYTARPDDTELAEVLDLLATYRGMY